MHFGKDSENDTVRMGRRRKGQPAERGRVSHPSKRLPLLTRPPFEASAGLECVHGSMQAPN